MTAGSVMADYDSDIAAKDAAIAEAEASILGKQELTVEYQSFSDDDTESLEQTRQIFDVGQTKYKDMEAEVKELKKKITRLSSNIFIMQVSYQDFYNTYIAYRDAMFDKDYETMSIKYVQLYRYSYGPSANPTFEDPIIGYWEIRRLFIKMGARWFIRSLHSVVATINVVRSYVDVKDQITGAISSADDGFRAVFDYAAEQGIGTIEEAAIEELKAAGSASSTIVEGTIAIAEGCMDPLAMAEGELKIMRDRVEKKEAFGYTSKELAITKMTEMIEATEELHAQTRLDADAVKAALQPVRDKIGEYEASIADHQLAKRTLAQQIKEQRAIIRQLERDKGNILYTHIQSTYPASTTHYELTVSSQGGSTISLNQATEAVTGHPTTLYIIPYRYEYGTAPETVACAEAVDGEITRYVESRINGMIDGDTLSASSTILSHSGNEITGSQAGTGEIVFTLPGTLFSGYTSIDVPCGANLSFTTSAVAQGAGAVTATIDEITVVEASNFYLIPERYKQTDKPVGETFLNTYFTFLKTTETPYLDEPFYIAYQLNGDTYYRYLAVEELEVTATDIVTHPDSIVSGKFILDGYMKADEDSVRVKLASLIMYAENITPTVSFVNYDGEAVSISQGAVPLDSTVEVSLTLSSGLNPQYGVDDYLKMQLNVENFYFPKSYETDFFVKEGIFFENFDYLGYSIPIEYEIIGAGVTGDFGAEFIGSIRYDDFYMTEPGNQTEYLSHKNVFYFEKTSTHPSMDYDMHGTTLRGDDVVTHFDLEEIKDILFDTRCTVGIRDYGKYIPEGLGPFQSNTSLDLIGGQLTSERNRLYLASEGMGEPVPINDEEEDDMGNLQDVGLFLSSNETHFIAGFNYNVVKLRMRDVDNHRYFAFKVMGPTAMDTHSVLWTFSDGSTQAGTFVRNGITWESVIEPDLNLLEVELFSSDMISQGKYQMANFVTDYPTSYGIDEDEFVMRMEERFEMEGDSYLLKDKQLIINQNHFSYSSLELSLPVNHPSIKLEKAGGVDMIPIEEITASGSVVQFYLGLLPRFALQVLQAPASGDLVIESNRIAYSAPVDFNGIATFRIDLYGAIANPYEYIDESTSYLKGIESRYLDVEIDYSGSVPVLSIATTYKSPIKLTPYISSRFQHYLEFDTAVTSVATADSGSATWITTKNDHVMTYAEPRTDDDFIQTDTLTINDDYVIEVTYHRSQFGSRAVTLLPGETYLLDKKYLTALYYHIFAGEILRIQPSVDQWRDGFNHRVLKDGMEVDYIEGGYPLDSFESIEVSYNPPLSDPDPQPAGLNLSGYSVDDSFSQYIFFFPQPSPTAQPDIQVTPASYDFGSQELGVPKTFTVYNNGVLGLTPGSITIEGTNSSSFYVSYNSCSNNIIDPAESCLAKVIFYPGSTGTHSASLAIASDDPDTPVFSVPLNGTNPDDDNDGIGNTADNCPQTSNPYQDDFDGDEVGDSCDPDDDNDGMLDSWEQEHGLNPFDSTDANQDADGDSFTNLEEYNFGSNPNVFDSDTDNNGIPDSVDRRRRYPGPAVMLLLSK